MARRLALALGRAEMLLAFALLVCGQVSQAISVPQLGVGRNWRLETCSGRIGAHVPLHASRFEFALVSPSPQSSSLTPTSSVTPSPSPNSVSASASASSTPAAVFVAASVSRSVGAGCPVGCGTCIQPSLFCLTCTDPNASVSGGLCVCNSGYSGNGATCTAGSTADAAAAAAAEAQRQQDLKLGLGFGLGGGLALLLLALTLAVCCYLWGKRKAKRADQWKEKLRSSKQNSKSLMDEREEKLRDNQDKRLRATENKYEKKLEKARQKAKKKSASTRSASSVSHISHGSTSQNTFEDGGQDLGRNHALSTYLAEDQGFDNVPQEFVDVSDRGSVSSNRPSLPPNVGPARRRPTINELSELAETLDSDGGLVLFDETTVQGGGAPPMRSRSASGTTAASGRTSMSSN